MLSTTVLLVDDEVPFVEIMTKRLMKRSLDIEGVHSGEDALKRLNKGPRIDVVVLDAKMPGIDGITTLKEIKRSFPLIEVIMLTGHGTIENGIEGMKLGAFDYLTKPVDIDKLVKTIQEAKNKKTSHEEKILERTAMDIVNRRGD